MEGLKMIKLLKEGKFQSIIDMMQYERALPDAAFVKFLLMVMNSAVKASSDVELYNAYGILQVAITVANYGGGQYDVHLWNKIYKNLANKFHNT